MSIEITCAAILGVLLFALGMNVTRVRAMTPEAAQFPDDPTAHLLKAIRAHGNAAEYVPMLALLIIATSLLGEASAWTASLAVAATTARLIHAVALLTSRTLARNTVLRSVGAVLTYISGVGLCLSLLFAT